MKQENDNFLIQKSRPLLDLGKSHLSLSELKILDTYLSRIDSHNPDKRTVVFEKGELERLLNIVKLNRKDLDKRLSNLMSTVNLKHVEDEKKIVKVNLFEIAEAEQDSDGEWFVKLTCTPTAKEYIFNIENLGYLKYRLKYIVNIKSKMTYILYQYLLDNSFRKEIRLSFIDLKILLDCDKSDTYNEYYRFNELVLSKIVKEINEKTNLSVTYKTIRKNRKVQDIIFSVNVTDYYIDENEKNDKKNDANKVKNSEDSVEETPMWINEIWIEPIREFNFTLNELSEIRSVLVLVPENLMVAPGGSSTQGIEFKRYHYINLKAMEIKRRNPNNKFNYLLKMLKNDAGIEN